MAVSYQLTIAVRNKCTETKRLRLLISHLPTKWLLAQYLSAKSTRLLNFYSEFDYGNVIVAGRAFTIIKPNKLYVLTVALNSKGIHKSYSSSLLMIYSSIIISEW